MKKIIFLIALLLSSSQSWGQTEGTTDPTQCDNPANLVKNPGFECWNNGPGFPKWATRGVQRLEFGNNSELGWWGIGTIDHYHRESNSIVSGVPLHEATDMNGVQVTIEPDGGTPNDGYYGFRIRKELNEPNNYMGFEYLCTKLNVPLSPGRTYNVSFKLRLSSLKEIYPSAPLNVYNHFALEALGVLFTKNKTFSTSDDNFVPWTSFYPNIYHREDLPVSYTTVQSQLDWRIISFTVTNNSQEELDYLTIGSFDLTPLFFNKSGIESSGNFTSIKSYYYVDDLNIYDPTCSDDCDKFDNDLVVSQVGCCINIKLNNANDYQCLDSIEINNTFHLKQILLKASINDIASASGITLCPEDNPWLHLYNINGFEINTFQKNGLPFHCSKFFEYSNCGYNIEPILQHTNDCCYDLTFQKTTEYDCDNDLNVTLVELDANGNEVPNTTYESTLNGSVNICDNNSDGILKYKVTYTNANDVCVGYEVIELQCDNCCNDIQINVLPSSTTENDCCYKFDIIQSSTTCDSIYKVKIINVENNQQIYNSVFDPNSINVELCQYNPDEKNIKFEFENANGDLICDKYITLPGCSCECPDDIDDWVIISTDSSIDCPDNCLITHSVQIPYGFECFTEFEIITERELLDTSFVQTIFPKDSIQNLLTTIANLNSAKICLDNYRSYNFTIKFYRDGDTIPCVVEKDTWCSLPSVSRAACSIGCDSTWTPQPDIILPVPGTTCEMKINYETREKCDGPDGEPWQDVHIYKIEIIDSTGNTSDCNLSEAEKYKIALNMTVAINEMDFKPRINGNYPSCYDQWRVTKASCWATWTYMVYVNNDTLAPTYKTFTITEECETDCCARRIEVCRFSDNSVVIKDLGILIAQDSCATTTFFTPDVFPNVSIEIPCDFTCDYLDGQEFSYKTSTPNETGKNIFLKDKNDLFLKYQVEITKDKLNLFIDKTNANNLQIIISDVQGKKMQIFESQLNQNSLNTFSLDLSKYNSGAYVYNIIIDGQLFESDKFIITK